MILEKGRRVDRRVWLYIPAAGSSQVLTRSGRRCRRSSTQSIYPLQFAVPLLMPYGPYVSVSPTAQDSSRRTSLYISHRNDRALLLESGLPADPRPEAIHSTLRLTYSTSGHNAHPIVIWTEWRHLRAAAVCVSARQRQVSAASCPLEAGATQYPYI
ncbi:hypothetical protein BV25DRAFT_1444965 [Artomyces pyxidatus]|uniref:Uncharacterized protein n=1 Tax=Artomyces pyxidatus TaxID=48021 RepID=A0ACB8SLT2_9AGAM|nr:hypothetical protein BV25DRAFT_1444965 [Artomyces pyxidatus]